MKTRRVVSLTAFISFFMMILTSIILYIVPQGRIAYWADWRLWGLSKEQWSAIHINSGFLFLIFLIWHIYLNWKPITTYLKTSTRKLRIFTREFNLALVIVAVCTLGTYAEIPPFSTILDISDGFKDRAVLKYGEPPYGHAELSTLKIFTKKVGMDTSQALAALRQAGFKVNDANQTLQTLARENGVAPQELYRAIQPAVPAAKPKPEKPGIALPKNPEQGTGNLTLADFCSQYGLDPQALVQSLAAAGTTAAADMTIKEIADQNGTGPMDIYETIRAVAAKN